MCGCVCVHTYTAHCSFLHFSISKLTITPCPSSLPLTIPPFASTASSYLNHLPTTHPQHACPCNHLSNATSADVLRAYFLQYFSHTQHPCAFHPPMHPTHAGAACVPPPILQPRGGGPVWASAGPARHTNGCAHIQTQGGLPAGASDCCHHRLIVE